jgi:uridine kinase
MSVLLNPFKPLLNLAGNNTVAVTAGSISPEPGRREAKTVSMYGANVIIFEGILAFHNEDIRNLLDMKVCIYSVSPLRHESVLFYNKNLLDMKIGIFGSTPGWKL